MRHHAFNEMTAMILKRTPDITSDAMKNAAAAINTPTVRKPYKAEAIAAMIILRSIAHI